MAFFTVRTRGAAALLLALASPALWASGGTGTYPLDWGRPGETLEYRSCGCADSCWVAEVKNRRTRQTLARLRCDCERLFSQTGPRGPEVERASSCAAFEGTADKPGAIRQALEKLLKR
ncbi:hypothetical protein [Acidovorax sp. A1169]|uniref:hypothetical protein n=1 Tax=Acidovorax sp. A1169 TaxID=3059524 RepID=UPI0027378382|nr:hypothetical protein [Acidovorax sp. A1169]MDP4077095.1 hypothetical protein [Acidovorax sp. A1169]